MIRIFIAATIGFVLLLAPLSGQAQTIGQNSGQLRFETQKFAHQTKFTYEFMTWQRQPASLSFFLQNSQLYSGARTFEPYSNHEANLYIRNRITDYSRTLGNRVTIDVQDSGSGLSIKARGQSQVDVEQALAHIETLNRQAQQEFLYQRYFIEDPSGQYVFPDHTRIATEHVNFMRPVANAIRQQAAGKNQREVINLALNFFQAIPYDELLSRTNSNGSGFAMPPGLLLANLGDCDTKSVALASTLRTLFPRMRLMMVYVPGHAFIGFNLPPRPGDRTLNINGETFVLAEPAGPAVIPVGQISQDAESALQKGNGNYSYREVS